MIVRIPSSTLFPYTTLFRSQDVANIDLPVHPVERFEHSRARAVPHQVDVCLDFLVVPHAEDTDDVASLGTARDRKSTRLNSSHPSISYAVFCLKKKKKDYL